MNQQFIHAAYGILLTGSISGGCKNTDNVPAGKPNFVYFFCDGPGIGDAGCYNPNSQIGTRA